MENPNRKSSENHLRLCWGEQAIFALLSFLMTFDYYLTEYDWVKGIFVSLVYTLLPMGILHLNYYVLIPRFFKKRQFLRYALACLVCIAAYIIFQRWSGIEQFFCGEITWHGPFSTAIDWVLYLLLSMLFWYFRQFQTERERQSLLRSEKLEAELKFLRTQISPHFIFNSLNNVYALTLQNHPNAAPMVARLADILRYVLYEGSSEKVALQQEIEVIGQFIELHRLRNLQSQNIDFYTEGQAIGWKIAPMLLLSFVENCFKHSQLYQDEKAWVRIEMEISPTGDFCFLAKNSQPAGFSTQENQTSTGIGLANAKRQLELGYPGRHELQILAENDGFSVKLSLQLEPIT